MNSRCDVDLKDSLHYPVLRIHISFKKRKKKKKEIENCYSHPHISDPEKLYPVGYQ